MTLLAQACVRAINRFADDSLEDYLLLAKKIHPTDPILAKVYLRASLDILPAMLEKEPSIAIHEIFKAIGSFTTIDYNEGTTYIDKVEDPVIKALSYCELANQHPDKTSECFKAAFDVAPKEHYYDEDFSKDELYEQIATTFGSSEAVDQISSQSQRIDVLFEICRNKIASDQTEALGFFQKALKILATPNGKTEDFIQLENRKELNVVFNDFTCPPLTCRRLNLIQSIACEALHVKSPHEHYYLSTYLDLLYKTSIQSRGKHTKPLQKIAKLNPILAANAALESTRRTIPHMQACLDVAESLLQYNPLFAELLLEKAKEIAHLHIHSPTTNKCFIRLASAFYTLGKSKEANEALRMASSQASSDSTAERLVMSAKLAEVFYKNGQLQAAEMQKDRCLKAANLLCIAFTNTYDEARDKDVTICKAAKHLSTHFPDAATTLLLKTFPKHPKEHYYRGKIMEICSFTEKNVAIKEKIAGHLSSMLKEHFVAIDERTDNIFTYLSLASEVYKVSPKLSLELFERALIHTRREKSAFTIAEIAERMTSYFPEKALELYVEALVAAPNDIELLIKIALLSGEQKEEKLIGLIDHPMLLDDTIPERQYRYNQKLLKALLA